MGEEGHDEEQQAESGAESAEAVELPADLAAASAAIDDLLADMPEEQARELLELALTEVVMKADPDGEASASESDGRAQRLDEVLDEQVPKYSEGLRRLGE